MRLCRSQPFKDTEFYTHDYLLLSPYIFYMPPYKIFSTARSQIFLHHRIFYRYNFTHASPILCSKSLHLHLCFIGSHLDIYKWFFIFCSQAYQIQHYFHKHKLCQQHEAITLSYFTLHFLSNIYRDYCGINLLLGHQYGSHYLYLNLKSNVVNCSSLTCILGLPTSPFLSAVQTARS